MGKFLETLGNAAMNGLTGGITGTIGSIMGGVGKLFKGDSNKKAEERQFNRTKELMGLQNQYNKEAAAQSQKYNEQMWDYTNYENQVAHLKNAGLNPGLLYGMSGGGGASTGGATQEGVSGVGQDQSVMMGINMRQMEAQTKLAEAEANKANAEASKISGVDTKNTEANTELAKAQKNLTDAKKETEKTTQALQKAQEDVEWVKQNEVAASAQNLWNTAQYYLKLAEKTEIENSISRETQEDLVEAIKLKNLETWSKIILNDEKVRTNKAEQGKMYAEIQRVINEKEYWDSLVEIAKDANNIKRAGVIQKGQEIYQLSRKIDAFQEYIKRKVKNMSQENIRAWIKSATEIIDCFGDNADKIMSIIKKGAMTGNSRQTGRKVKYDKEGKIESYEDIWSSIW
jgi:hypothetical protein